MPDIARLGIKIESDQAKVATDRLDKLARSGNKAERATDGLGRGAANANRGFSSLQGSMAGAIAKVGGITALAAGAGLLAKNSLQAAAEMERMRVEFGVFMQDAEAGSDMFDQIQEFAASTPLAIKQLSGVARQLMSFGTEADEVLEQMQMLGDAALGDAQKMQTLARAFGRVQARGRATMEEINMAMEAGLPIIAELAENLDVTKDKIFEMVSAGEVSFEDLEEALTDMTSEGGQFNDGMEKLAETFQGRLSTAMDNVKILGGTMFEPALEGAKDFLGWVADATSGLTEFIEEQRRLRDIRSGEVQGVQITQEEYEAAKAEIESFQSDIQRYERAIGRLNTKMKYTQDDAMREILRGRRDQQIEYLTLLENQLIDEKAIIKAYEQQREEKEATAEAAEEAANKSKPPWWAEYEFGVLKGESGVEEKIRERFQSIDETARAFAEAGWDYNAAEEKSNVVKEVISNLLSLDPDEAGGRFFADDNTIKNLLKLLDGLSRADVDKGTGGIFSSRDSEKIDDYLSSLREEARTLSADLAPAQEKYNRELQDLEQLKPWLSTEQYAAALEQLKEKYPEAQSMLWNLNDAFTTIGEGVRDAALQSYVDTLTEIGSSLVSASEGAMSFGDAMLSVTNDILQVLPQLLLSAGLQLITVGQWVPGLALVGASGLLALGAGAASYYESQNTSASANGNVFSGGEVVPYSSGGIVTRPKLFPMARGGVGLMGEAGPEAILPLSRGPNGKLGVQSSGAGVTVNVINASGQPAEQRERRGPNGERQIEILVGNAIRKKIANGDLDDVMSSSFGVQRKGWGS
jgi:tape measure domain-containing protein